MVKANGSLVEFAPLLSRCEVHGDVIRVGYIRYALRRDSQ